MLELRKQKQVAEFFQTRMGQYFYEGTIPRAVRALERIADALEKLASQKQETDTLGKNEEKTNV